MAGRYGIAALSGLALYCLCYHPWIPYGNRERSQGSIDLAILILGAFIVGMAMAWGRRGHGKGIWGALLGGMSVANAVVIGFDLQTDPTAHNLLPLEFVILGVLSVPALIGAAFGGWLGAGGDGTPPAPAKD